MEVISCTEWTSLVGDVDEDRASCLRVGGQMYMGPLPLNFL